VKVIFLDIDGVLNSDRSQAAFGHRPWPTAPRNWQFFDEAAVRLLARVVEQLDARVVLSSSWRADLKAPEDLAALGERLGLPIIGATPFSVPGPWGDALSCANRGEQIAAWLSAHPKVASWVIVDDVDDMLLEQKERFVHVDGRVGLSVEDAQRMAHILARAVSLESPEHHLET
jgi:hypothetical protein